LSLGASQNEASEGAEKVVVLKGRGFSRAASLLFTVRLPLCRRRERSPKSEATDLTAFVVAVNFLLAFSAQKSHVKPQNHLIP
jgi:hypothetical protein